MWFRFGPTSPVQEERGSVLALGVCPPTPGRLGGGHKTASASAGPITFWFSFWWFKQDFRLLPKYIKTEI